MYCKNQTYKLYLYVELYTNFATVSCLQNP